MEFRDPGWLHEGRPLGERHHCTKVIRTAKTLDRLDADAVAIGPRFRARTEAFRRLEPLGLRTVPHSSGLGDVLESDGTGATPVPGVHAAGNVSDPALQVLHAAADGSRVGAMVAVDLAAEDLRTAAHPSANQADWDHRYSGDPLWSGNPNGSLVREARELAPGRALDVGAGEGGDAFWLAQQGWAVTASDISSQALARVRSEADRRGLDIECLLADANGLNTFPRQAFDLVTAHYASIPRTPDHRGICNLIDATAAGGTLLVVSHDRQAVAARIDTWIDSQPFDPDAYVQVEHVVATLAALPDWEVQVHERRPRPPGATSASHHVDDVVLRARRRV